MDWDLIVWIAATVMGTCTGLLHVALAIRALRRSVLGSVLSLLVPLAAPAYAWKTGARRAAVTYGAFLLAYAALVALSL